MIKYILHIKSHTPLQTDYPGMASICIQHWSGKQPTTSIWTSKKNKKNNKKVPWKMIIQGVEIGSYKKKTWMTNKQLALASTMHPNAKETLTLAHGHLETLRNSKAGRAAAEKQYQKINGKVPVWFPIWRMNAWRRGCWAYTKGLEGARQELSECLWGISLIKRLFRQRIIIIIPSAQVTIGSHSRLSWRQQAGFPVLAFRLYV